MKNHRWKKVWSILLAGMICFNLSAVSYADHAKTETDYDYIQKMLTEVGTIEESLNSMGISFSDVMKAEFKNEEMNRSIAEAFLSEVDDAAVNQLLNGTNTESEGILRSKNNEDNTDPKKKEKKYSERLCYARKIAEINKKRDHRAKDIDSETMYMYISHYLDIPGGPLSLDKPVDSNSEDGLYSAWITDNDRKVYENYLSMELKNKAKKASAAFETYAQMAYKEQSLQGLTEYEESLHRMKKAMEHYDKRYAHLAFLITVACYSALTIDEVHVGDIKIPIPVDLGGILGMEVDPKVGELIIDFPHVEIYNAKDFINKFHAFYQSKLHIENKAMRDLYLGMGLSMGGILRYASSMAEVRSCNMCSLTPPINWRMMPCL